MRQGLQIGGGLSKNGGLTTIYEKRKRGVNFVKEELFRKGYNGLFKSFERRNNAVREREFEDEEDKTKIDKKEEELIKRTGAILDSMLTTGTSSGEEEAPSLGEAAAGDPNVGKVHGPGKPAAPFGGVKAAAQEGKKAKAAGGKKIPVSGGKTPQKPVVFPALVLPVSREFAEEDEEDKSLKGKVEVEEDDEEFGEEDEEEEEERRKINEKRKQELEKHRNLLGAGFVVGGTLQQIMTGIGKHQPILAPLGLAPVIKMEPVLDLASPEPSPGFKISEEEKKLFIRAARAANLEPTNIASVAPGNIADLQNLPGAMGPVTAAAATKVHRTRPREVDELGAPNPFASVPQTSLEKEAPGLGDEAFTSEHVIHPDAKIEHLDPKTRQIALENNTKLVRVAEGDVLLPYDAKIGIRYIFKPYGENTFYELGNPEFVNKIFKTFQPKAVLGMERGTKKNIGLFNTYISLPGRPGAIRAGLVAPVSAIQKFKKELYRVGVEFPGF